MMHYRPWLLIPFLVLTFHTIHAQTPSFQKAMTDTLQGWFVDERYQEITDWVQVLNTDTLNASILYLAGLSYFVQGNDDRAFTYLDKSIVKDPRRPSAYYYIGLIYSIKGNNRLAAKYHKAALRLDPKNPEYTLSLANSLFEVGAIDSAYGYLKEIEDEPNLPAAVYIRMADIQLAKGEEQRALDHYYDCLQRADLKSEYYNDCLYNIGYFEYENGNYADADLALSTLASDYPEDFLGLELLIKTLIAREEFFRAGNYIRRMYQAESDGDLPTEMEDKFQLDQFTWEGYDVLVYERFQQSGTEPFSKHIFYVLDERGEVKFKVFTEYNPAASTVGQVGYFAQSRDGQLFLYFNETVDLDHINYPRLKRTANKIMENKIEPTSIKPDSGN